MTARVTNRMPEFFGDFERKAVVGMTKALILGASEAAAMTPIDTSVLLNSQFRKVEVSGERIVGTVGYTAAYALPVHDPERPQNFRRASARKEFLRLGFERAERNIRRVLAGEIKT